MKLLCWLIGCKWREHTFTDVASTNPYEMSVLICERCGKAIL